MNTRQARTALLSLATLAAAFTLTACDKGPAEKTGAKVDKAVEKTGDAIKDAVGK